MRHAPAGHRHSREGGNPEATAKTRAIDPRLRGNDACGLEGFAKDAKLSQTFLSFVLICVLRVRQACIDQTQLWNYFKTTETAYNPYK